MELPNGARAKRFKVGLVLIDQKDSYNITPKKGAFPHLLFPLLLLLNFLYSPVKSRYKEYNISIV